MAARSSKRVSKGFYKDVDLNDVSTADFLKTRPATKTGPFYQVERVLSQRKLKGKVNTFFLSFFIILLMQ